MTLWETRDMSKPFLLLQRLLVQGNGRFVYDETYHVGVNIIRGKNSSGKSTITDFIFYLLGGENVEWTDEAASCDWVSGEINLSCMILSLRREIKKDETPAIAICDGPLSETLKSQVGWSSYGRSRSSQKESFSQFIFDRLGLPQTKSADSQTNITMYQVLRVIYGDQSTDSTSILRKERQPFADRQDIRSSVGEMLLGIDDLQGHDLRQEQIQLVKDWSEKKSRFQSLREAAEKTDPNFRLTVYSDVIKKIQEKQSSLDLAIEEASARIESEKKRSKEIQTEISNTEGKIRKCNKEIEELRTSIADLSLSVADSEVFIETLKTNLRGLIAADRTRKLIGDVALSYCPICLADLGKADENCCPLCKSSTTGDAITGGRIRYAQEIKHQINESKIILDRKKATILTQENTLKELVRERSHTIHELRTLIDPSARIDAKISQLLKDHGYLTRQIEDLGKMESLQTEVNALESEVQKAKSKLDDIDRRIKSRQAEQESRRNYCQELIGKMTIEILHRDILMDKNDTLQDASGLVFSFEKDFLSVRHGRLSASTQAFLKNSYYLGLLRFAAVDPLSRFPMFFILDNIEDKGMTPERFRNFHHLLIEYSDMISIPHQVIITTSYIDESLKNSRYCVGPSYEQPPFTLDLKGEWGMSEKVKTDPADTNSAQNILSSEDDLSQERDFAFEETSLDYDDIDTEKKNEQDSDDMFHNERDDVNDKNGLLEEE